MDEEKRSNQNYEISSMDNHHYSLYVAKYPVLHLQILNQNLAFSPNHIIF